MSMNGNKTLMEKQFHEVQCANHSRRKQLDKGSSYKTPPSLCQPPLCSTAIRQEPDCLVVTSFFFKKKKMCPDEIKSLFSSPIC